MSQNLPAREGQSRLRATVVIAVVAILDVVLLLLEPELSPICGRLAQILKGN